MARQRLRYFSDRAVQEQEAAKVATCAESRLIHFDLAARYRMQARSIELTKGR